VVVLEAVVLEAVEVEEEVVAVDSDSGVVAAGVRQLSIVLAGCVR
jgi:hypothetical protein